MCRLQVLVLFICSSHTLSAQITNDSLQKLLVGTEAQIRHYTKNPGLFTPLALQSITMHMEILKSINVYQDKTRSFTKKVRVLDSNFYLLKLKTSYVRADSTQAEKIFCQLEQVFKKREGEIIGLKLENQTLKKQNYYLRMDTTRYSEKCRRAKESETKSKGQCKALEKRLKLYEHGTYWGLSLGFNYFFNNPPNYYIKPDSTIGTIGAPKGVSFLVSAIIGYKFNDRHSFIFNVPLGDFTRNSQNAIGLFNQKLAGGLGYAYHISGVSMIAIMNISPYERLAPEMLDGKKIEGDVYSKIDLTKYPTSTAYSPSFTLGMSYNFLGKPSINTTGGE